MRHNKQPGLQFLLQSNGSSQESVNHGNKEISSAFKNDHLGVPFLKMADAILQQTAIMHTNQSTGKHLPLYMLKKRISLP